MFEIYFDACVNSKDLECHFFFIPNNTGFYKDNSKAMLKNRV